MPNISLENSNSLIGLIFISTPIGSALVLITSIVCGLQLSATSNIFLSLVDLSIITIASEAAVASSNNEALAIGSPVISVTIV